MRDWARLLRHVTGYVRRAEPRSAALLCALTVGQAGVIAGMALSQRALVDSSAGGHVAGVAAAVAVGALAYGVSAAAGRVRGNLMIFLVGRVRGMLSEEIQRRVSSIPTVTHLEHAPYVDRWNRIFDSSQALAAMPWSTLDSVSRCSGWSSRSGCWCRSARGSG